LTCLDLSFSYRCQGQAQQAKLERYVLYSPPSRRFLESTARFKLQHSQLTCTCMHVTLEKLLVTRPTPVHANRKELPTILLTSGVIVLARPGHLPAPMSVTPSVRSLTPLYCSCHCHTSSQTYVKPGQAHPSAPVSCIPCTRRTPRWHLLAFLSSRVLPPL
jgi:hypothetical protein